MHLAQRGFTLIEVLVALIVFSLGLVGVATLTTTSVKYNHTAYLGTQAAFAAASIAERMHVNQRGVWAGAYDGVAATGTAPTPDCSAGAACNPLQLAAYDMWHFGALLDDLMPNAVGQISCTRTGYSGYTPLPDERLPFDGMCTVSVTWQQATDREVDFDGTSDVSATGIATREFVMNTQP